jgi:hypothetical protein
MGLATADQLIDGSIPSTVTQGTFPQADFINVPDSASNNWTWNHPLPNPLGVSNHFTFARHRKARRNQSWTIHFCNDV